MAAKIGTFARLAILSALILTGGCSSPSTEADEVATPDPDSPVLEQEDLEHGLGSWGPERPTFSLERPAGYPSINSTVPNSRGDDERNFFQVKEKKSQDSTYNDSIVGEIGGTYTGFISYQNAASTTSGPAEGTALRLQIPSSIVGTSQLSAVISAENTTPAAVWDSVVIALPEEGMSAALRLVPNSALIHTEGPVDGHTIPDSLFSGGAPLGCESLDGVLPGTSECSGYITFDFVLDRPDFTIATLAKEPESLSYQTVIESTVGETVTLRAEYRNTGTTQQNDVVLRLELPPGMELLEDSVAIANSRTGRYETVHGGNKGAFMDTGLNIGSYAPGSSSFLKFLIRIDDAPGHDFAQDGQIYRFPRISAITANGPKDSYYKILIFGPLQ